MWCSHDFRLKRKPSCSIWRINTNKVYRSEVITADIESHRFSYFFLLACFTHFFSLLAVLLARSSEQIDAECIQSSKLKCIHSVISTRQVTGALERTPARKAAHWFHKNLIWHSRNWHVNNVLKKLRVDTIHCNAMRWMPLNKMLWNQD